MYVGLGGEGRPHRKNLQSDFANTENVAVKHARSRAYQRERHVNSNKILDIFPILENGR